MIYRFSIQMILSLLAINLYAGNLTTNSSIFFADSLRAARFIVSLDAYTGRLSAYDRSAGMKTDKPVDQQTYLNHCAQNVRAWSATERKRFNAFIDSVAILLKPFHLNLPDSILLIKTTSLEMGGVEVAYTRQNGIFITRPMLRQPDRELRNTIIHEIFHVLSRRNKELQKKLYALIGFSEVNEIKLPPKWDMRRITNPDAPRMDTVIRLNIGGKDIALTPFLFSGKAKYNPQRPGGIFQSINFMLLEVIQKKGIWKPLIKSSGPVMFQPGALKSFWEKIGKNTQYILHPEEILASNFVLMVTGKRKLPSPWVTDGMRKLLSD